MALAVNIQGICIYRSVKLLQNDEAGTEIEFIIVALVPKY